MRSTITPPPRLAAFVMIVTLGCGGAPTDQLTIPDTPNGTARAVLDGLSQRHPEVLWRALPPSYQQDVNGLASSFAENMDPVLFDRVVSVARKSAVVLQSKKELILATETVRGLGLDETMVDSIWESYIHVLDAILASDLARLEAYPTLDVDAVLGSTGNEVMTRIASFTNPDEYAETLASRLAGLEQTSVELVEREGDGATIRLIPPDAAPTDVPMTRIEGRWLPDDLVRQWPGMIDNARSSIELLGTEEAAQARVQLLFGLGIAEGFIDQIEQMESAEEIDRLVGGIVGSIMAAQRQMMVAEG
jgi:hypothetical protein